VCLVGCEFHSMQIVVELAVVYNHVAMDEPDSGQSDSTTT